MLQTDQTHVDAFEDSSRHPVIISLDGRRQLKKNKWTNNFLKPLKCIKADTQLRLRAEINSKSRLNNPLWYYENTVCASHKVYFNDT